MNWQQLQTIALNTYRETIRDKLLYSLIGFAVLVIAATWLAGTVSLGQDIRVIKGFGLTAILVFLLIITLFVGTQLVYRELERRTIYLVLSKPLKREVFILGKFFGLVLTLFVSSLIMAILFIILLYMRSKAIDAATLLAILFIFLEAVLLTAVGILFSTFSTPLASAVYTFSLFLIGHSSTTIYSIAIKSGGLVKGILLTVYYLFPNLEKFNLRNFAVYQILPQSHVLVFALLYFIAYVSLALLMSVLAFRKYEF